MISISPVFAAVRRLSPSLTVLGLALAAGLSWTPASAATAATDWQAGCQFKTIPGSGGEGLRYDACLRLETCQRIADAAGQTIFQDGCFGVAPDRHAMAAVARPTR
jgi:hypothetical protein